MRPFGLISVYVQLVCFSSAEGFDGDIWHDSAINLIYQTLNSPHTLSSTSDINCQSLISTSANQGKAGFRVETSTSHTKSYATIPANAISKSTEIGRPSTHSLINPQCITTAQPGSAPLSKLLPTSTTQNTGPQGCQQWPEKLGRLEVRNPTFPEPTSPPNNVLKNNPMCVFLGAVLGFCHSLTPGFNTLNPSIQADCICYSSTVWAPYIFDGAAAGCAGYASTADPNAYAPLANMEGFCERIGDIKAPKSTAITTTTYTKVIASHANPGCSILSGAISSCMEKTTGFEDMEPSQQAKCFCYNSATSWVPTSFDNAINTCVDYAKTADLIFYTGVTSLISLCAHAGDILGTVFQTSTTSSSAMSPTSTPPPGSAVSNPTSTGNGDQGTEIDTTINLTYSVEATRTPAPIEANRASTRKVKQSEVIGVSFCCAVILLFL